MSRSDQPTAEARSHQARRLEGRPAGDIAVAGLLAAAGGLHLAALPDHLHSAAVGAFLALTAIAQLLGSVLVATRPSRRMAAAVIAGNLVLLALWAVSRTTGLPVGGDIGAREPLAALDGLAAAMEILAVAGALRWLAGRRAAPAVRRSGWRPALAVAAMWLFGGAIGTGLAEPGHSHDTGGISAAEVTGGLGHIGHGDHRH